MERTLVALWFADIAGYSAHAPKDESVALRLVLRARRVHLDLHDLVARLRLARQAAAARGYGGRPRS